MKTNLITFKDLINKGSICPYCLNDTEYVDSREVYGISYGMIYICKPCKAWVGVHKGTNKALGRLADHELRAAKKEAHYYFDQISKTGLINKIWNQFIPDTPNRAKAYLWLSIMLKIPTDICHIGMFDVEDCNKVVELCKKHIP